MEESTLTDAGSLAFESFKNVEIIRTMESDVIVGSYESMEQSRRKSWDN